MMHQEADTIGAVVQTLQIAHVTFTITAITDDKEFCNLYSSSKKEGVRCLENGIPYNEALIRLQQEIGILENALDRKRGGEPTASQVYFLFRNKIPIHLDLTWGQASDLIDEKMKQILQEKEDRRKTREEEKEAKRKVKEEECRRVTEQYKAPFQPREMVLHSEYGAGYIVRCGSRFASGVFLNCGEKDLIPVEELKSMGKRVVDNHPRATTC